MNGYCDKCENHCTLDNPQCGKGREHDDGNRGFDKRGHHPDFDTERGFGHGHGFDDRRGHRGPDFERNFDEKRPHCGPDFERDFGDRHGHRGPHGRPPMPDGEALRQRVAAADLGELLGLAGRLMPRGHGGPARGQALILSILAGREALSQRELQQMLGVRPGSMSEIVTKLERKGYLSREKGDDRRGNLLRITDEGREAMPSEENDDTPFDVFTEDQRTQLADLLRILINHWIDRMD